MHLLLLMLKRQPTLNRPDPHRCRLQRRVSEDRPAHGLPPPNSFRATVRCRACDPIPHGLLHSDQSLNSVHSQSELDGSVSISNLCLLGSSGSGSRSGRFLLVILRITNRFSFVSASGGSLITIGFLVALCFGTDSRSRVEVSRAGAEQSRLLVDDERKTNCQVRG